MYSVARPWEMGVWTPHTYLENVDVAKNELMNIFAQIHKIWRWAQMLRYVIWNYFAYALASLENVEYVDFDKV